MERISEIRQAHQNLTAALTNHPKFAAQKADRKGKVYFMHDFATRTDAMFDSIMDNQPPPDTPATRGSLPNRPPSQMTTAQQNELKREVIGRCQMLCSLVNDEDGKTAIMFGERPGQSIELGVDVKGKATVLKDLIDGVA